MSESATSELNEGEVPAVSLETGAEELGIDSQEAVSHQYRDRIGGAARELKSILALSKEAKFDINLTKKRKSDHRRYSNEGSAKSSMAKRDHRPIKFPVTAEAELETTPMLKKEHRPTRFPVTAESELEMELPGTSDTKLSEESPTKPLKRKKLLLSTETLNISGSSEERKRERKSFSNSLSGDILGFKPNKDMFCWRCHREGVNIACETCPRSYHARCLKQTIEDPEHWPCPECVTILKAESTQSRSPAMKGMTLEHLCSLLKFAVVRMKQVLGAAPFAQPVDTKHFPEYEKYIIQPMDLSGLEANIRENLYGSTHAFEADAKWILHNSIIFNSYQSKLTSAAKTIMKICKQEMAEIENCPTCYLNANTKKSTWFVEVCPKPHLLVWAKLKGFPYWPGKVMSCRDGNVDVRFFGAHDRAWVPEKECFLYMPRDPNGFRSKRNDIEKCIRELEVHVENLKQVFGQFCYPEYKIPIDPNDELKQLQIVLPQYKSYVNRTKRHRLFNFPPKIESKMEKVEVGKGEEVKLSEETDKVETEGNNLNETKTETDENEEEKTIPTELLSKDDSEQMEGYGTDDESMPLIDIQTRKRLLDKSVDDGQNGHPHGRKSFGVLEKFPTKGLRVSREPKVSEPSSELLKKDLLEKIVDPRMFSDDSSRLSDKINTVDVLEDMEINLGNDEGSSCVNISRKNSFDSSDYSRSDSESNTSSRKGPVKMDVENFEVILTSPTKLKIVDKLMKKLSDGSSDERQESPKHKVVRKVSDSENETPLEADRGEISPEPKQLEEPPIDYSENESETVESSKKLENDAIGFTNDETKVSKIDKKDLNNEQILQKPDDNDVECSDQIEPKIFEKVTEDITDKVKTPIYVITKDKPSVGEEKSVEGLKIKITRSKVEEDGKSPKKLIEEPKESNEVQEESKRSDENKKKTRKSLIQEGHELIEESRDLEKTYIELEEIKTQLKNEESSKKQEEDKTKKSPAKTSKPSASTSESKENDLGNLNSEENHPSSSSNEVQDETCKVVEQKLSFPTEQDVESHQNASSHGKRVFESASKKESLKERKNDYAKEQTQERKNDYAKEQTQDKTDLRKTSKKVLKSSSRSELEKWTRKVIGIGTIFTEEKEKDIVESPQYPDVEQMESEEDDLPLAHIQAIEKIDKIDKENILKVIHSDLVTTPIPEPDKTSTDTLDLLETPTIEDTPLPPEESETSPGKTPLSAEGDEAQQSLPENPEKPENKTSILDTNLTEVLKEVSKSKNVEIVSEPESNISEVSSVENQSDNLSPVLAASRKRKIVSESSEEESPSNMSKLLAGVIPQTTEVGTSTSHSRKRKLSGEKNEDKQKKTRAQETEGKEISSIEKLVIDEDKMDEDEEKQVTNEEERVSERATPADIITEKEKDIGRDMTCRETLRKSPENEELPQISLNKPVIPSRKYSTQSNSSNSNSVVADPVRPSPETHPHYLDEVDIKSEPNSDSEGITEQPAIENLEAKKKYLSALNILERDSEAFHQKRDTGEIRTRSKTEEKKKNSRMVDNLTKIIDDVAVNYGAKKALVPLSRLHRRSLDEPQPKNVSTPPQNRSENGEIFVKSFAKIVPAKPRARKSFPQSFPASTEARQMQQIKMVRREDSHSTPLSLAAIRDRDMHSIPSSVAAIRDRDPAETEPKNPTVKIVKENVVGNANVQPNTGSHMAVLQQLENMTTNKSYIIVTSQNQDVVLLPPNKPISYQTPPQTVMSVAPVLISSAQAQPSYKIAHRGSPLMGRSKTIEKPTGSVNLTDSQNYIPFNKESDKMISKITKQVSLLVSKTTTPAVSSSATASAHVAPTLGGGQAAAEDEDMPLQSGSVTSNARDIVVDSATGHITNGIDNVSSIQEDFNGPTQSEDVTTREANAETSEDDEFRLINNLIPGSVAKVVHEIVQRPPPKLKPRPPGMLSTAFSEGVPSSAGTVTSKINSVAHRLSDYLRGMLIETLDDLGKSGNHESTITSLNLEIEALKHKHSIELSEIEKNMCTVLKDIQRSIVEDRERIVEETRTACEAETIKRIEEAKSKQWCANCLKEAQFYCCWNTSYCDYPCQQKHWPQHMTKCTQNSGGGAQAPGGNAVGTATVPTVVRPLGGQQLILRPSGAKSGALGRVFAKPVQKVYLNRNTTAPKTLRVQSANGGFLTVMEAPPGQYQVVSTLPPSTLVRAANPVVVAKKTITVTSPGVPAAQGGALKPAGQKTTTPAKIVSHSVPAPAIFEEESD